MWKKALENIDEKYIAEAAEYAPAPTAENHLHGTIKKEKTGNLAFAISAEAVVAVSLIGVGFLLKGTGIEPLSPAAEVTSESPPRSDEPVSATTAIGSNSAITTSIIGEYAEITTLTAPIDRESYQDWLVEAEKIKEDYSKQIEEKEKEILECEKHIENLKKKLETEKFKEQSDYDKINEEHITETIRCARLWTELEQLKIAYNAQVLLIETNRKTYEQLYPTTEEIKQPLTMEKLKALVSAKGAELTWSDFEQFEGIEVGSGLYIMEYPIDEVYSLLIGGVPEENPWYVRLAYKPDDKYFTFSISDNGSDGFEEFLEMDLLYKTKTDYRYVFEAFLEYDENNHAKVVIFSYKGEGDPIILAIPEGVTEIGEDVFADCTQLEAVTLPSTLEVIGAGAFKNCTNLKDIAIPYGVKEIGAQAFASCISIPATLTLPDTVTVIGDGAFAGCTQFDGTCKPKVIISDDFSIICPVDNPFITTEYTGNEEKAHSGIDYAAELGSNIYAAADGVVIAIVIGYKDNYNHGKYIIIDHGSGFSTFYSHLDSTAVNINDRVSAGDIIGYMGHTGWATGPHLHFELIKDGETVNPQEYMK